MGYALRLLVEPKSKAQVESPVAERELALAN
jgi:hypothetical protein